MANSSNEITRTKSLADLLAQSVSDGDYGDVVDTVKIDTGTAVPATQIYKYGGQLVANLYDDAVKRTVQNYYLGTKLWSVRDSGARNTLGSDADLAVNDLLYQTADQTLWYCVSVDSGTSSTWAAIPMGGGGEDLATTLGLGNITGGSDILISSGDLISTPDGSGAAGDSLTITTGVGDTGFPAGSIAIAPAASSAGTAPTVTITGGATSLTSGAGGDVFVLGGDGTAGNASGGSVNIISGAFSGTGAAGDIVLTGGDSDTSTAGNITLTGGTGNLAGSVGGSISGQAGDGGSSTPGTVEWVSGSRTGTAGDGGRVLLQTGNGFLTGTGGALELTSGNGGATGNGGTITLLSGDGGSTSGSSGDIVLQPGAVTLGSRGSVLLYGKEIYLSPDVTINLAYATWPRYDGTAGDQLVTDGAGNLIWQAAPVNLPSFSRTTGYNGNGSTNTNIIRWDVEQGAFGGDITYVDSATLGGYWDIATTGIYTVCVTVQANGTGSNIRVNIGTLSNTLDASHVRGISSTNVNNAFHGTSWTGEVLAGDTVWCSGANFTAIGSTYNMCSVTRVV